MTARLAYLHLDSGRIGWPEPPAQWMLEAMRQVVDDCISVREIPRDIPAMQGWRMSADGDSGRNAALWTLWRGEEPALAVGMARTSLASAGIWQAMTADMPRGAGKAPPTPWCSLRLLEGSARMTLEEMAGAEAIAPVIAWAWLARPAR